MSTAFEVNLDDPVYMERRIECHPISPRGRTDAPRPPVGKLKQASGASELEQACVVREEVHKNFYFLGTIFALACIE